MTESSSRDEPPVHAWAPEDIRFIRASAKDAKAVASFLLEQDVRPAPREADVAAFIGRSDSALFCAMGLDGIVGVGSYVADGTVAHIVHLALRGPDDATNALAAALIGMISNEAREASLSLIAAQVLRDSRADQQLRACGFTVEWEEKDAANGRVVTMVDLVRVLGACDERAGLDAAHS